MPGTRGRSGGRNRKSVAELVTSGTFRPSRHRHLLAMPQPAPLVGPAPPVPKSLIRGLQAPGRALVKELWATYAFTVATRPLLRIAGEAMDARVQARAALAAGPVHTDAKGRLALKPYCRLEARAARTLMDALRQMDLEP